jgi:hypothetical protein
MITTLFFGTLREVKCVVGNDVIAYDRRPLIFTNVGEQ